MRGIETRLDKLEKKIPCDKWVVLMQIWDSNGELIDSNEAINPTLSINVIGVEPAPDMIINHRSASSSPIEKCEE